MMNKFFVVCCSCLLMAGCAGVPNKQPLSQDIRKGIHEINVVEKIPQKEIYTSDYNDPTDVFPAVRNTDTGPSPVITGDPLSSIVATALASALSNTLHDKLQAADLAAVKKGVKDYDFSTQLKQALASDIDGVSWLAVNQFDIEKDVKPREIKELIQHGGNKFTLVVYPRYYFTSTYDALVVDAEVMLVTMDNDYHAAHQNDKSVTHMNGQDVVYKNIFTFYHKPSGQYHGKLTRIAVWKADNAKLTRQVLQQSVIELADMITHDIQDSHELTDEEKKTEVVLRNDPHGQLVRRKGGSLLYQYTG